MSSRTAPAPAHQALPAGHILLALMVVAIWGTNFVVVRLTMDVLPPLTLATMRFFFTLLPAVLLVRRPSVGWSRLAAFGLLMGFGQFSLLYIAMDGMIAPGLASLVVQSQVFFTIGMAMWRSGERVRGFQIAALVLAVGGIAVIMAHTGRDATPLGVLMTLGAAFCWAAANIVSRESNVTNMLSFVVWSSLFTVPPLFGLALLLEGPARMTQAVMSATTLTWATVMWQTVANTLFGYVAWGWLLSRHPAATITPLALLIPVFGMMTSTLVLHESLPAWKLIAGALVLGGLGLNMLWPALRLPGWPWRRGGAS